MRAIIAFATVGALGIVATACSDELGFFVDNTTDKSLAIWGFEEDCSQLVGYQEDYSETKVAPPFQKFEYYELWGGGSETKCIQAVDSGGRLLLNERYEPGKVYRVDSDAPVTPMRIPDISELPKQSWWSEMSEAWREDPIPTAVVAVPALSFGAAMLFAAFITIRHFYRYFTGRGTNSRNIPPSHT